MFKGHAKFMGCTGPMQMGYGPGAFFTHIKNRGSTFFRKRIYGANTFFFHCHTLFFTLDTICADSKDKPMTGCKNQLKV